MHHKQDKPHKILIVDDGKDFREAFREFLALFGYQVQEASDGREALDLLRRPHGIALVLLDVHLPGSNGLEVLTEIKKIAPKVSIIFLTGYNAQDIEASVPQGHIQGCIEKTTDPDRMKALIEKVLQKHKHQDRRLAIKA